jgi:hypothetical protein
MQLYSKESHNPLTLDEKKALISQIHKLPAERMDDVVDIIRSATDVRDEGDNEVEISLDDLDTHTLRRLQSYVYVSLLFLVNISADDSYFKCRM